MNISTDLKQAAITIRNRGRQAADNNPSNGRRVRRAKDIFKMVMDNRRLFAFGEVAWITLKGSRGETYSPTLREDGSCVCQCVDSKNGFLCKHRLALAAAVIASAANNR